MCKLCDEGTPQDHETPLQGSRRDFLKASTATAVAAAGLNLLSCPARADDDQGEDEPGDSGKPGRRYIIRGGSVMTMDPSMRGRGEYAQADVRRQLESSRDYVFAKAGVPQNLFSSQ